MYGNVVEVRSDGGGKLDESEIEKCVCVREKKRERAREKERVKMAADHAWSGLKPSRARTVDARGRPDQQQPHQAGSSSLRGSEWAPSWVPTPYAPDESWTSPWSGAVPGHGAPTSLPVAPARRKGLAADSSICGRGAGGSAAGLGVPGQSLEQQPLPHREGLKRSLTSSPRWGTDRRLYLFGSSPCSETKFDAEMTMFESQITRTVSDHLSSLISDIQAASPSPTESSGSEPVAAASSLEKRPSLGSLRRKRSGISETHDDVQGDCGWNPPLKLVVRKGLTLSDVGELGRIIIPKKDAESMHFPQIDTKEGAVLEMEDYCALKRWHFRFKYWTNNKSRMYVLENTGDFVRYHSLKEHDVFVVYEDVRKNLGSKYICRNILKLWHTILDMDLSSNILDQVVRGQKNTKADNLLDDTKVSSPETPPASATEDESDSRTTDIDNMPARSG